MNVYPVPLILDMPTFYIIYTKGKHRFGWIEGGINGLVGMMLSPEYHFYKLISLDGQFIGICWVYEVKISSARIGILVWERVNNFDELVQLAFIVFKVKTLIASVDKSNNVLCKKLLKRIGFTEQEDGLFIRRN